jgi:hypothetical protein
MFPQQQLTSQPREFLDPAGVNRLLVNDNSPILVTLYTRATRRHVPEDGTLHSHRRENL